MVSRVLFECGGKSARQIALEDILSSYRIGGYVGRATIPKIHLSSEGKVRRACLKYPFNFMVELVDVVPTQ